MNAPLLEVTDLAVHFAGHRRLFGPRGAPVRAVDGVSFDLAAGETLGLVGESGCGKTTTGRAVVGLQVPSAGRIRVDGSDVASTDAADRTALRRRVQIVFQDPFSSLNPRRRVRDILRQPLDIHRIGTPAERRERVASLMAQVGLRPDQADAFPHQFSGGQRQRIGIARALALSPKLIVCDEPVSALDVSVQAQVLNLFAQLQRDLGLSYLFISHDLGVVRHVSRRIAVMYRGRIVELATTEALFERPTHPYTALLLASAPVTHPRERRRTNPAVAEATGPIPSQGCAFAARCPLARDRCQGEAPALTERTDGRLVACHER